MMTFLLLALGTVLVYRLARATGAVVLGALAWIGVVLVALSVLVGEPVPTGALIGTLMLWVASQLISRAKHGAWRSRLLRSVLPI